MIVIVIVVIVTGGKQSQLLAFALGLGWSLTKVIKMKTVGTVGGENNDLKVKCLRMQI